LHTIAAVSADALQRGDRSRRRWQVPRTEYRTELAGCPALALTIDVSARAHLEAIACFLFGYLEVHGVVPGFRQVFTADNPFTGTMDIELIELEIRGARGTPGDGRFSFQ